MKRENLQQYFAILIFIIPLMIGVYLLASKSSPDYKNNLRQLQSTMAFNYTDADVGINSFKSLVETGKIQTVYYNESDFILIAEDKTKKTFTFENPKNPEFRQYLMEHKVKIVESSNSYSKILSSIAFAIVLLFIIRLLTNFYSKKTLSADLHRDSVEFEESKDVKIRFSDVAGSEEAKENMQDIIEFLKNPKKFEDFGAKIPKGIILYGPPGTGKTLLAKALAGETGSEFIPTSGSYFIEKYVGVGASRVRKLFNKARKNSPAIIFIDEIDAIGGKRGSGKDTSEDAKTLNQLLVEMDGFNDKENVIVVAATNRLDMLDDALLRAGRFDRHVMVGLPDLNARYKILKVHSKNKPLSPSVDLFQIAKQTVYMSGADLANVINEASIYAIKENYSEITLNHIDKAMNKIIAGDEKKDRSNISDTEKRITAYHEAGHALIAKLLNKSSVPKVSIIPTTKGAAGYTIINPNEKMFQTKKEILNKVSELLGGRASEEIIFGKENITGGAANDLQRATKMVVTLIAKYGMSEKLGLVCLDDKEISLGNELILRETKQILDKIYNSTLNYIIDNKNKLQLIAEKLLENEIIDEHDLEVLIAS
ncbi:cell division protein FtsH [Clostridium carboxidivorans P7]|uniref:ATP-dependent zinc metalloprotease FtsH n=2 Tax=Clostridium TaxID=1485 RepID=C6PVH5_9CLOT|nr:AAA family ATPase [Clostridium carboxidivorans]AKN29696.1 cell division protein FtsH [Clostridium carboxidivorans P7]EET86740.1 ATP-dependent metalloprotease FtsH [Clostridium carboxidivorans P7]